MNVTLIEMVDRNFHDNVRWRSFTGIWRRFKSGEVQVFTEDGKPVARLISEEHYQRLKAGRGAEKSERTADGGPLADLVGNPALTVGEVWERTVGPED